MRGTFFGITPEQDAWLSQEAERRQISRSAVVRALIDKARQEGDHALPASRSVSRRTAL